MSVSTLFYKLEWMERKIRQLLARPFLYYTKGSYAPTYLGLATPGVTTYTTQDGWYIRVGSLIFYWGHVVWTAATGTGAAIISIPFTAGTAASGSYQWSGSLLTASVTIGTFSPQMQIPQATAYFRMWQPANNAAATSIVVEAAGEVIFSGFYSV